MQLFFTSIYRFARIFYQITPSLKTIVNTIVLMFAGFMLPWISFYHDILQDGSRWSTILHSNFYQFDTPQLAHDEFQIASCFATTNKLFLKLVLQVKKIRNLKIYMYINKKNE